MLARINRDLRSKQPAGGVSRRALLAAGSLAGTGTALGAAALLAGGAAAQGGRTLTHDVACDGRTFSFNRVVVLRP